MVHPGITVSTVSARVRRCAYCDAQLGAELGPAARYCNRSHRQRAYENRQADQVTALHREIRHLKRLLASYERVIDTVAAKGNAYATAVNTALHDEALAALNARRVARGRGTEPIT